MKTFQIATLTLFGITAACAQPREGRHTELSISGSYQNYSSGSSSGSSGAFLLSPRVGFYLVKGFEIEPEALLMLSSGSDAVYMLNGNLSYNFIDAGKSFPFVLLGYGLANTVPVFNVPITNIGFRVGVLNIGGGVKAFVKDDIAIRVEYRFQRYYGQKDISILSLDYSFTRNIDTRIHTVSFGLSILL